MKLGPKQKERIEGWLKDLFQQYEIKELDVRDDGVNFKIKISFTNKKKQGYSYDATYEKRKEIYDKFLSNLKYRDIEKGKITTVDEIADEWKKSKYIKEANSLYTINFKQFEQLVKSLLARKPYEDVQHFCDNIRGKILVNYDEFYESLLNDLTAYYQSESYLNKVSSYEQSKQPTRQFLALCYSIDEYYSDSYVPNDYRDLEQFIDIKDYEINPDVKDSLNDGRLQDIVDDFNEELKDMINLQHPDKPLFVTYIGLDCDLPRGFNINIEFSDKLSKHQIEQLIESLTSKDFYFEVTYENGYYETRYDTIDLHYEYSHSRYF